LAPADFFFVPKPKSTFKGRRFQTIQEITEKLVDGVTSDSEKGVPGLFPEVATAFEAVHRCKRGVL
jgi:hypothetical protein